MEKGDIRDTVKCWGRRSSYLGVFLPFHYSHLFLALSPSLFQTC